jgi:two-component system phosphate regulon sensor histidine kinase PhoR
VRLANRLFLASSLLVAGTTLGLGVASGRILREGLEGEVAAGLEREARLVAALLPADSAHWPELARTLGAILGHRVTLVDAGGTVRGDTDFDRASLARLENHGARPEIRAALVAGVGRDRRVSASTNEQQMYVAVRGGPSGLAAVRVAATLARVHAQVAGLQRAIVGAGLVALIAAAAVAWLTSRALARPLVQLTDAARDLAAGRPPTFPATRVPELARHAVALRRLLEELDARFAALTREREETRTLIEAMSDGVIAANVRGEIVSCNAAGRRLLDYREDTPLPPLGELFHDKRARDLLRDVLAGADVEERELALDGRTLLVTGRTLPDGGTLLVLRDITALRHLETVRRDFVANASHELKTPLTSIAGYAETLASDVAAPDAKRFAQTILANARRMQHLLDGLLDLSRVEAAGWHPDRRVVELEAAAREAWTVFAGRAADGGVTLEIAVSPAAHALAVDPDALRQIFTNLFDNALRHTPAGGRIRVTGDVVHDSVVVAVHDTGSGIASEHLPRIFERFYRIDAARAREGGGTGLGLAIVKHLVEGHGGRVDAESQLGQGTTIRMSFPTTL